MMQYDYPARLARAQELMKQTGLDALLLATGPNLYYLAGFAGGRSGSRPYVLVLPRQGDPVLIVHQARAFEARHFTQIEDVRTYAQLSEAPVEVIWRALDEAGAARIGLEFAREHYLDLQVTDLRQLQLARPAAILVDASDLLWELRVIKSASEIEAIRQACRVTGQADVRVFGQIESGMAESEIEERMLATMIALGGRSPWVLITSGEGCYDMVSKTGTDRRVEPGDMVWMDAGCAVDGYYSDFSRAGVVGGPTDAQRRAQQQIHDITMDAVRTIHPGVRVADLAAHCNAKLESLNLPITSSISGLAARIGHGLGLAVTEWPSVNEESQVSLDAGMVITVEPGVATPFGTFHVEENVLVTQTGHEVLSTCSWELRALAV